MNWEINSGLRRFLISQRGVTTVYTSIKSNIQDLEVPLPMAKFDRAMCCSLHKYFLPIVNCIFGKRWSEKLELFGWSESSNSVIHMPLQQRGLMCKGEQPVASFTACLYKRVSQRWSWLLYCLVDQTRHHIEHTAGQGRGGVITAPVVATAITVITANDRLHHVSVCLH